MKVLIVCLLLSLSVLSAEANFTNSDCTEAGTTCLTCYSQKLCISLIFFNMYWSDWSCPIATPYCNVSSNECTNIRPDDCEIAASVQCPLAEGRFPILNDCSNYYDCANETAVAFYNCEPNYVYNQAFGKCVLKLTDSDCKQDFCSSETGVSLYPNYPTLYYECDGETPDLFSCPEGYEYDSETGTCESLCNGTESVANTVDCTTYFACELSGDVYVPKKQSCPSGRGFDRSAKDCYVSYDSLCNEMALIEGDLQEALGFLPGFVHFISEQISNVFNFFGVNVPSVLMAFGVNARDMSDGILVVDYVYKYRWLPQPAINFLVNFVMSNMPDMFSLIFQIFFPSNSVAKRDVDEVSGYERNVADALTKFLNNIDIREIFAAVASQNITNIVTTVRSEVLKGFNLTDSDMNYLLVKYTSDLNWILGNEVVKLEENGPEIDLYALCSSLGNVYRNRLQQVYLNNFLVAAAIQKLVNDNIPCLNA